MQRNKKHRAILVVPALFLAAGGWADNAASNLQELENRIKQLEQRLEKSGESSSVKAKSNGRSLVFENDNYSFQVGGRLQLDAATYREEHGSNAFGDGTRVRRLFLDVRGTVYDNWRYRFQYDFARPGGSDSSARGIRDAWLQYTGLTPTITIGQFKEPFGLEHLTSSLHTTFIEQGLTSLFSPDRRLGVGISHDSRHWTAAAGVFGEAAEGDVSGEGDEGWDLTARVTYAPLNDPGRIVHLGLAGRQHNPEDSVNSLRLRERPESAVTDVRLIDTGVLNDVEHSQFVGAEAAAVVGPFSVQSEWITAQLDRDTPAGDLDFEAWYVYASWVLTGESRTYKNGVFDRIQPASIVGQGGIGAWEVALRFSAADLNDKEVIGGEQQSLTFGVNWHATPNLRFAFNYTKVLELDRPGSNFDDEKLGIASLRAQIEF